MYCKSSKDYKTESIPKTVMAKISVLTPSDDKDFIVRKVTLAKDGSMPNHTNKIQHQQFVLKGEAKVIVGEEMYHAKEGDFIYIPAGIEHCYEACFGKEYEFLCMITTKEDEIKLV